MRTVLEKIEDRHLVEVPCTIVGLYSLKNGQIFEIKTRESKKVLFINMATMLSESG